MGEERQVSFVIPYFSGQWSGRNRDTIPPSKGRLCYNLFTKEGVLKKAHGSSLYLDSDHGSDPIRLLRTFRNRWVWQIGTNFCGESAENLKDDNLYYTAFDKEPLSSDIWQDALYLANGKQLKLFDGAEIKDLGMLPPGNGSTPRQDFTLELSFSAGLLDAGNYKYVFTYYDSTTQTESLPNGSLVDEDGLFVATEYDSTDNPLGWTPVTIDNTTARKIRVRFNIGFVTGVIQRAPTRVDKIRIYRALNAGAGYGDYRFVTEQPIDRVSVFLFEDNTAQASLGEIMLPEELVPPPLKEGADNGGATNSTGAKFIKFWRDSLFLFGADFPEYTVNDTFKGVTNKNFASDSILYGSDTFLPEYYPFNWNVGKKNGQKATGLALAGDTLCAFKERSIYTVLGDNLNNYIVKIRDNQRGCIAPRSLQETPYGVIFMASDGICLFDGSGPSQIISNDIADEIKNINILYSDKITSQYIHSQNRYIMFFPSGTSSENTRYVSYDFDDKAWGCGYGFECASIGYAEKTNAVPQIMIGSRFNGRLYDWTDPTNVNYNGNIITSIFRSSEFDFDHRDRNKRLTFLYLTAACSINYVVDIAVYADYAQGSIYDREDIDSESDYATYGSSQQDPDSAVYDVSRYSGPITIKKIKVPIYGIGRTFYVEILEKQNNALRNMFQILSIEVEGVLLKS